MPIFDRLPGQRKLLLIALLGVGIPLTGMLLLQYSWLSDLQTNTLLAKQATLRNYLELIDKKTELTYAGQVEQLLVVPASELRKERSEWRVYLEQHSEKIALFGVKQLFMLGFREENPWSEAVVWDLKEKREIEQVESPLAVRFSTAYLQSAFRLGGSIELLETLVDERDPRNPVVLRPVRQPDADRLLGVIGIVIDPDFFADSLLPKLVSKLLPEISERNPLRLLVKNGQKQVVFRGGEIGPAEVPRAEAHFSYIFRDWEMELYQDEWDDLRLARWSFFYNISLSLLLAALLAAGTAVTFRMAAREMRLSQMKNDFVSNVSHELKTPLSSIRVFAEMMRLLSCSPGFGPRSQRKRFGTGNRAPHRRGSPGPS